jgi:RNA polymerase sigma-70 factor (ECF subfamily)
VRDFRGASDEELLRLTPRHPRAFDEFYVRHEGALLGYFRRRTDSPEVALDLTGETFVKALASVRRFRPGGEPAIAWLFGIARHTLIDSLRRGRVADRARTRMRVPAIAVEDEDLDRIDRLGSISVGELLAALPREQADAIRARVFDEQPYGEVAVRLKCSPLVARKRVSRGLATLRTMLSEEAP